MTQTYQARYRLLIGAKWREPGQLVPEAQTWVRVDSLVHHGRLILVEVSDEQLASAVASYCPELADQIIGAPHPPAALTAPPYYPPDPLGQASDIVGPPPESQPAPPPEQIPVAEQEPPPAPAKKAAPRKRTASR